MGVNDCGVTGYERSLEAGGAGEAAVLECGGVVRDASDTGALFMEAGALGLGGIGKRR